MLTKLSFKNFKAWKDSGEIRLAPLTVLFGTNSAGKTSIPQLLLLLKQTAESPDRQQTLQLGDERTLIDVGTYEDAVYGHDTNTPLEFSLSWDLDNRMDVSDPISGREYSGSHMEFRAKLRGDEKGQPHIEQLHYGLKGASDQLVLDLDMVAREVGGNVVKKLDYDLRSTIYSLERPPGRPWPLPSPLRFYGFPDEATAYFRNTAFASDFVLSLERMLNSVLYVGPLREYPKRLYLWSGEVPAHVGWKGDRAVEAILASGERAFNWKPKQRTRALPELVAERLQQMGLIREFRIEPIGSRRKEYEVLVQTSSKLPEVKLTDVGFGVSQVLPVIVECFYVPRRSIVLFEQPEIHLHPRVQADLADLFVDAIRARENGKARDCQFIIESHSEHFLRRLQRRIAEEELSKDETALYFINSQSGSARIEELDVDDYGNIKNWPDGFFGDEMEDLVARTEAQARRMKKAASK